MTIQECYAAMGGNYDEVVARLRAEDRIAKFLVRILDDKNMELLANSVEARDLKEAFRAAHTMKGICLNLSLTKLGNAASDMTEVLRMREEYGDDIREHLNIVQAIYEENMKYIRAFKEEHLA